MRYLTIVLLLIGNVCWSQKSTSLFKGTYALEVCDRTVNPICNDGYEESYRYNSYMVNYDHANILNCYDTVFSFEYYESDKKIIHDSTLYSVIKNDTNIVYFFKKKLKRRMNSYLRRNKRHARFDGNLKYKLFEIEFLAEFDETTPFLIPNEGQEKKGIVRLVTLPIYRVTKIMSVTPVVLH